MHVFFLCWKNVLLLQQIDFKYAYITIFVINKKSNETYLWNFKCGLIAVLRLITFSLLRAVSRWFIKFFNTVKQFHYNYFISYFKYMFLFIGNIIFDKVTKYCAKIMRITPIQFRMFMKINCIISFFFKLLHIITHIIDGSFFNNNTYIIRNIILELRMFMKKMFVLYIKFFIS
jgi:hypothetical protein